MIDTIFFILNFPSKIEYYFKNVRNLYSVPLLSIKFSKQITTNSHWQHLICSTNVVFEFSFSNLEMGYDWSNEKEKTNSDTDAATTHMFIGRLLSHMWISLNDTLKKRQLSTRTLKYKRWIKWMSSAWSENHNNNNKSLICTTALDSSALFKCPHICKQFEWVYVRWVR